MGKVTCIVCPNSLHTKLDIASISSLAVDSNIQSPLLLSVEDMPHGDDPYKDIRLQCEQLILTWGCPFFKDNLSTIKRIGVIAGTPVPFVDKNVLSRGTTIYVANGRIASSVAEHAIYLALDGLRDGAIGQRNGFKNNLSHFSLANRNVGIIGMGSIGRKIAQLCFAFHSTVSYYDPYVCLSNHIHNSKVLDELILQSEVLFLCASHTRHTESLLYSQILCKLPPNAVVINISRGALMPDEEILATTKIRPDIRFRIDVIEKESYQNSLFAIPSVRISSHVGGPIPEDFKYLISDLYSKMNSHTLHDDYISIVSSIEQYDNFSII